MIYDKTVLIFNCKADLLDKDILKSFNVVEWEEIREEFKKDNDCHMLATKFLVEFSKDLDLYRFKADGLPIWHYIIISGLYIRLLETIIDFETYLLFVEKYSRNTKIYLAGEYPEVIPLINLKYGINVENLEINNEETGDLLGQKIKRLKNIPDFMKRIILLLRRASKTWFNYNIPKEIDLMLISPSITFRNKKAHGGIQDDFFTDNMLDELNRKRINYVYIEWLSEDRASLLSLKERKGVLYEDYFRLKYIFSAQKKNDSLIISTALKGICSSIAEKIHYKNIDISGIIIKIINNTNVITDYGFYSYLIDVVKPKIVMSICATNTYTSTLGYIQHTRGLKSIEYQHGGIFYNAANYLPDFYEENDNVPVPDYYFVWGDYYKYVLTEGFNNIFKYPNRYKENNIIVTGSTKIQDYLKEENNRSEIINDIRGKLKLEKDDFIILVAASKNDTADIMKFLNEIDFDILKKLNRNIIFVLKPHPGDTSVFSVTHPYVRVLKGVGVHIYDMLSICDLCMCMKSTVGIEALIFSKPVVIINGPNMDYLKCLIDRQAAFLISNHEEFYGILQKLCDITYYNEVSTNQRFVGHQFWGIDRNCIEEISSKITDILGAS